MTDDPLRGIGREVRSIDDLQLAWKELSDLGNAERLGARFGERLMCVEGKWMGYDGRRWSREDGERLAAIAAHSTARAIRAEADALEKAISDDEFGRSIETRRLPPGSDQGRLKGRVKALRDWAVLSGNSSKINGMLAQAEHLLNESADALDVDPYAINVLNGTLRVHRRENDAIDFELRPHDPADRLTRLYQVEYDPKAKSPKWDRHLTTCLPDPTVREFFRTVGGYLLTGETNEQCIFILQGKGGDGKSTTMNVLRRMMGSYAISADVRTFLYTPNKDGAAASPDRMRFKGDVRLISTQEPPRNTMLDDSIIKQLTGGSPMPGRQMYGEQIEFNPRGKLVLEVNQRPRISGDDDGIWRRIMIVLFPHQFKGVERDKRIEEALMEELPGVLNWALQGLMVWMIEGQLSPPEAVTEAVEDYRRSANPFGEWMAECLVLEADAITSAKALYESYKGWCERNDVGDRDVMSNTAFGRALGDKQILRKKDGRGIIQRRGARLRSQLDAADHDDIAAEYDRGGE